MAGLTFSRRRFSLLPKEKEESLLNAAMTRVPCPPPPMVEQQQQQQQQLQKQQGDDKTSIVALTRLHKEQWNELPWDLFIDEHVAATPKTGPAKSKKEKESGGDGEGVNSMKGNLSSPSKGSSARGLASRRSRRRSSLKSLESLFLNSGRNANSALSLIRSRQTMKNSSASRASLPTAFSTSGLLSEASTTLSSFVASGYQHRSSSFRFPSFSDSVGTGSASSLRRSISGKRSFHQKSDFTIRSTSFSVVSTSEGSLKSCLVVKGRGASSSRFVELKID